MNEEQTWEILERNRKAFAAWIRNTFPGSGRDTLELYYLDACGEEAEALDLAGCSLFALRDPDQLRWVRNCLSSSAEFCDADRRKNGRMIIALDRYLRFCEEEGSGWVSQAKETWCAPVTDSLKPEGYYRSDSASGRGVETASGLLPDPDPEEDSAPEEEQEPTSMEILLGTSAEDGQPVVWKPNDTSQLFHINTGIIGTMGTGKTQLAKSLIAQLVAQQEKNFLNSPLGILIFDYKGDYNESKQDFVSAAGVRVFKPYHLPFNPLALTKPSVFKPLLPSHTGNAFKDTISKVYHLGPKQQSMLFRCIMHAYQQNGIIPDRPGTWSRTAPTFAQVYQSYKQLDEGRGDSLMAAMEKLSSFEIFEPDPAKTGSLYDLISGAVVIDLSGYDPDIQSLVVELTLNLFYAQMHASGSSRVRGTCRELRKIILVDEADHFMGEGFPSLRKILKEGREFGVGTVLSTQSLQHFSTREEEYAQYILTWIVHNVADLKQGDVEFVFRIKQDALQGREICSAIRELRQHQSMVKIATQDPVCMDNLPFWKWREGAE